MRGDRSVNLGIIQQLQRVRGASNRSLLQAFDLRQPVPLDDGQADRLPFLRWRSEEIYYCFIVYFTNRQPHVHDTP